MTTLRPAGPSDAAAVAALRLLVTPFQVFTADALRHSWASTSEAAQQLVLVAEEDSEIVGFARALFDLATSQAGSAGAFVMVHPDRRRRGIGSRLYDVVEAHLRQTGAAVVVGHGDDGDFPLRRGYERRYE